MAVTLEEIIKSIDTLSEKVDKNVFITSAREAFKTGINTYEISDEEKAKLIAQYEAQVSIGVITQIMNLAKELPEIIAREALLTKQTETQEKQTLKIGYESMETKARTLKNYGFDVEVSQGVFSATDKKIGMIDKQIISEMWRHRDMKAGVIIKNKSVYTTLQNAKFEEARTKISLKANQDNMYLKKAEHKVAQLNAVAMDEDYIISSDQLKEVGTIIDDIDTKPLEYKSEITTTFTEVEISDIVLEVLPTTP